MRDNGVKGIKVDFFGGDKQEAMRLYEDILSDANEYGLMVIFHGCTLPRGWDETRLVDGRPENMLYSPGDTAKTGILPA